MPKTNLLQTLKQFIARLCSRRHNLPATISSNRKQTIPAAIARIQQMECYMDEVAAYLESHQNSTHQTVGTASIVCQESKHSQCAHTPAQAEGTIPDHILAKLKTLSDYQESGQWLKDYALDESGALPANLKRGVLSEDKLYNFLIDAREFLHL